LAATLGIDLVAGDGDALNTQDNIRRDDAEHNTTTSAMCTT
jgi:hypothetical protein